MKLNVSVRYTRSPHVGTDVRVLSSKGQAVGFMYDMYTIVSTFHFIAMNIICICRPFAHFYMHMHNSFHISVFSPSFSLFSSSHYAELNDPLCILIHFPDPCREELNPDLLLGSDLLPAREPLQRFAVL